jgi:hypothetical protein
MVVSRGSATAVHFRKLKVAVSKFCTLLAALPSSSPDESLSVLVVLNGGVQSGVPPFTLRQYLLSVLDTDLSAEDGHEGTDDVIVHYGVSHLLAFASGSQKTMSKLRRLLRMCDSCVLGEDISSCRHAADPFFVVPERSLVEWQTTSSSASSEAGLTPLLCCWTTEAIQKLIMPPTFSDVVLPFRGAMWSRGLFLRPSPRRSSHVLIGDDAAADALRREMVLGQMEGQCMLVPVPQLCGLYVVTDCISTAEHDHLLAYFRSLEEDGCRWVPLAKRHVIHFNRRFIYGSNTVGPVGDGALDLPAWACLLQQRLAGRFTGPLMSVAEKAPFVLPSGWPVPDSLVFDQITVNKYHLFAAEISSRKHKGVSGEHPDTAAEQEPSLRTISSGIAPHVDAHSPFGDVILSLSLGSHTVMNFKKAGTAAPVSVLLPPRSLLIMSGEARYAATHGIAEKTSDILTDVMPAVQRSLRYSITLRQARLTSEPPHTKANCSCPELCDAPD